MLLDKGVVVEQGTHEELLSLRGRYYQLVLENEPGIAPTHPQPDGIALVKKSKKYAYINIFLRLYFHVMLLPITYYITMYLFVIKKFVDSNILVHFSVAYSGETVSTGPRLC